MQRPGFNIQCNDGNKARWGFCLNCASQGCQNDDSNDADAAIGIGLAGQSTPTEMGAGWTNYFASGAGTCSANSMTHKSVWVFVLSNVLASKPFTRTQHTWSTVMKIGKTTTLGFSSAYWENDQLLNENTDVTVEGDGKYSSYLSQAFKTIRMCVGSPDSGRRRKWKGLCMQFYDLWECPICTCCFYRSGFPVSPCFQFLSDSSSCVTVFSLLRVLLFVVGFFSCLCLLCSSTK